MANKPGVWGIDIGQCAFKAIRLENIDGTITATAFDYIEHPKILSQPDADADVLTREALDKFLERNSLRGDIVVIGIPGQSGLARFVKLPPVEEKKIGDIVRFEAKQQIPFPLEEVIWDYQKIGSGLVTDGFAMETEIGLFAMKRDMIHRFMQHFLDVHIEVHMVQMAPLALCNFIAFELLGKNPLKTSEAEGGDTSTAIQAAPDTSGKKRCAVALDIGTDNSNLVITDGDRIIWQRPIPLGGNHFTRALTKDMKLTFAKAEHLKRNATKSPDLKKILAALKPVLNEFVGEVQRSLGYFTNTHRDAQVEYMMGLGNAFRLPGLQKYLSEKLSLDVRKMGNLNQVTGETVFNVPAFSNNVLSFAMAYGLAVQGLHLSRIHTNLLPQEIRVDREIRAKKPWAVATAAALMVGITASLAGYSMQFNAVAGDAVKSEIKQDKDILGQISAANSAYTQQEQKVTENATAIKNFIAGQDERLNWITLNQFINDCLPVPAMRADGKLESFANGKCVVVDMDGKKQEFTIDDKAYFLMQGNKFLLEEADKKKLKPGDTIAVVYQSDPTYVNKKWWGTPNALDAYRSFWNRQTEGKATTDTKAEDEGVGDLISINIESVFTMYSTDMATFWSNLQRQKDFQENMIDKNAKPPEGKGWVVELRGYTYHQGTKEFLMETLVKTLATKAKKPDDAAAGGSPGTPGAPATPGAPSAPGVPATPGAPGAPGAVPAAAAKPAEPAPPPAKPGEPAAPGKDNAAEPPKSEGEAKPAEKKPDPFESLILGKINTVYLYTYQFVQTPVPGQFVAIDSTVVPDLLQSQQAMGPGGESGGAPPPAGGGGGPPAGGPGGDAGPGGMGAAPTWSPLTDAGGAAGMGGGGGGGGGDLEGGRMRRGPGMGGLGARGARGGRGGMMGGGGMNIPGGLGRGGPMMGRGGMGGMGGAAGANAPPAQGMDPKALQAQLRQRTPSRAEFIILFVWQEPTPSDDRLEGGGGAGAAAGAPPAGAPGVPPPTK